MSEANLGDVVISPEVLEVIVGVAASKVEGVYSLRNKRLADSFGKKNQGRGIYITQTDDKLTADIYVYLTYGVNVPSVAMTIQKEVVANVQDMSDLVIDEVNVHIAGVVPEKRNQTDFSDIFDEGFLDVD